MATPSENAVSTTDFNPARFRGEDRLHTLLDGTKWGGPVGRGVTLDYSFPEGTTYWATNYSGLDEPDAYSALDAGQRAAVRSALGSWAAVADVGFVEVPDTENVVGELRFGFTANVSNDSAAHAYPPFDDPAAGDVWFNSEDIAQAAAPGSYFYATAIHEIGRSLGLNHAFGLKPRFDNLFYSVMSYTASPWSEDGDNYASFYPTTPMWFDILALQAIYGKDGVRTNPGNTTYTFTDGLYFETIMDTGGNDTIVYAGSDSCEIFLTQGNYSSLSQLIEFNDAATRHTVTIGPGTVIENATGGQRGDRLEGNGAKNLLVGNAGADKIKGGNGHDTLVGGAGKDRLEGQAGQDRFDFNDVAEIGHGRHDLIVDFTAGADDIDLSSIDAKFTRDGNNKFSFVTQADTTLNGKAGELCWYVKDGDTFVMGDVDGNKTADFILELAGTKSLTAADFIL